MDCVKVGIRHSCLCDMPEIVDIEHEVSPFPWNTGDFMEAKAPGTYGHIRVAIHNKHVVGYIVFGVDVPGEVDVIKLAVKKEYRRKGVGTALLNDVRSKMWEQEELIFYIRESNLSAQLFLKKHGFKATLERKYFANQKPQEYDGDSSPWHYEDAYRFTLTIPDL